MIARPSSHLVLSNAPWVSMSTTATSLPDRPVFTTNTLDHMRMPVVSLSEPPRQWNPLSGLSWPPSQALAAASESGATPLVSR